MWHARNSEFAVTELNARYVGETSDEAREPLSNELIELKDRH